jgi:hypothetical protein
VGPAVTHRIYCSLSRLVLLPRSSFPLSSPEALQVNRPERHLSAKGGTMGEKCPIKFSHTIATSTVIVGLFYMPQSCDMGPMALLPLRRKACWEFFRPKNPTASAGFEPAKFKILHLLLFIHIYPFVYIYLFIYIYFFAYINIVTLF